MPELEPSPPDEEFDAVADAVVMREREAAEYSRNVAMYETLVDELPTEWPERLQHLQGMHPHKAAALADTDDVGLLAALQQGVESRARLHSEMLERSKSERIAGVLRGRIPQAERDARIDAARGRANAEAAVPPPE